ncbi:MAG: GNAT family N-acetyltransferase, partial [Bacillota bacterium]|nr:GNAT family N-acetyltransferase [Bacillota bacterium]
TRRNDIRKAEKDGIMIDISDNFEQAFCLVEKTYTRQKRKATFKSSAFNYYDVLKKKNQCKCFFAKDINHEPIAVVFIIWDNKRCYYLLGGYDSDKSHHGASALAMWEAMKFAKIELGVSEFDFEGSMVRPIERFFRKFGGEQIPLYSVSWENSIIKNLRKIYHNYLRYR